MTAQGAGLELIRDPGFVQGFSLLAPKAGDPGLGRLQEPATRGDPVWQLAQWHSRFPLTNQLLEGLTVRGASNLARYVALDRRDPRGPGLTLGVDSRPEYAGGLRSGPAEPWIHLLVQQEVADAPPLNVITSLQLRAEFRLHVAETFRPEGYSPDRHAAQFQVVFTVNNTRRGSSGFGDYLWFVVPVYDDRYELPPPYVAQDFAVTRGKLIFNPGAAAVGLQPLRPGVWQTLACELRPRLDQALAAAWAGGYLAGSRDPADYRIAHLNLGWEVPGLNRVALEVRGLSLQAFRRGENSGESPAARAP
jgi:hypothetical protein